MKRVSDGNRLLMAVVLAMLVPLAMFAQETTASGFSTYKQDN